MWRGNRAARPTRSASTTAQPPDGGGTGAPRYRLAGLRAVGVDPQRHRAGQRRPAARGRLADVQVAGAADGLGAEVPAEVGQDRLEHEPEPGRRLLYLPTE